MWLTVFLACTAILFLSHSAFALWHLRWVRRLPTLQALRSERPTPARPLPRCSIVIAARNEEARIEQTVRQLLAQEGVENELIIVDDRSTDHTGEILHRLAFEYPRVRVSRIEALPDGWLGKCYACHVGARSATGDWILFTDADCWLKPDVIARAIRVAEHQGADHLTLTPGTPAEGPLTRAWHLLFLTSLLNWFSGVNRDRPRSFLGIGAFNLVRASAYKQCGGYEALRLTVVDDIKLGLLIRRAGKRTRAFLGEGDVECHWGSSISHLIKVMEKNYFAALDYRLGLVLGATSFVILVFAIVIAGLLSGTPLGLATAISSLSLIFPAGILARRLDWPWTSAFWVPFMFPIFIYALLNSTFWTLRRGGIRWRETFYPLKALRSANVR